MNIKSKKGLAILDAMLLADTWDKHYKSFDLIFHNVDIDWLTHMISTDINGRKIIKEYDSLLQHEIMIKTLNIIQNNIDKYFK